MRFVGLSSLVLLSYATSMAAAETHTLDITITDITEIAGNLNVALFTSESTYQEKVGADGIIVPVNANTVHVSFHDIAAAEVLVLLFHDLNSNGELDTNFLGLPTEPYASSTGKRGRFGPPSWRRGKVPLHETAQIRISLK